MDENASSVFGVSPEEWQAAYRLGIQEFYASKFIVKADEETIRIAFGISGPPLNEEGLTACPTYTHAVSLTPALALELSRVLGDLAGPAGPEVE